jgi:hypothetical protein
MDPIEQVAWAFASLEGKLGDGAWANAWFPAWESDRPRASCQSSQATWMRFAPDNRAERSPCPPHPSPGSFAAPGH